MGRGSDGYGELFLEILLLLNRIENRGDLPADLQSGLRLWGIMLDSPLIFEIELLSVE